MDPFRLDLE